MLNFSTDIILLSFDKMKDITLMDSIFEKNKRTCLTKSVEFLITEVFMEL